jgi:hypothetical protein
LLVDLEHEVHALREHHDARHRFLLHDRATCGVYARLRITVLEYNIAGPL